MSKKKIFDKILKDIKEIKIQGARNVAKAGLKAYSLFPTSSTKRKLLSLRPTEPMMENILNMAEKSKSLSEINSHFDSAQEKINKSILKLIKSNDTIFTHCHSTNVVNSLIYSKKHGKHFEVYNTETRPLFQGRKTAKNLKKAGIKVTMFIDSAIALAIEKENSRDKFHATKVFLGADALLKNGVINKIGSGMIAELAKKHKIPVYIVADSWKFSRKPIRIENRNLNEVWDNAPRGIKIKNPAFEFVPKSYISGIVTELGLMSYDKFVRRMK
jgi:ribose 1,5-bisphosphate isomerase